MESVGYFDYVSDECLLGAGSLVVQFSLEHRCKRRGGGCKCESQAVLSPLLFI